MFQWLRNIMSLNDIREQRIDAMLALILLRLEAIERKMDMAQKTLDDVVALVTAEDTKIDSLIALIAGLKQQIADALSGVTLPPAVQAKVDAVFDAVTAQAGKVQGALDANVPPTP